MTGLTGLGESTLHPLPAHFQGEKPPPALELQLCRQKTQHNYRWTHATPRQRSSAAAQPVRSVPAAAEVQPAAGVRGDTMVT